MELRLRHNKITSGEFGVARIGTIRALNDLAATSPTPNVVWPTASRDQVHPAGRAHDLLGPSRTCTVQHLVSAKCLGEVCFVGDA